MKFKSLLLRQHTRSDFAAGVFFVPALLAGGPCPSPHSVFLPANRKKPGCPTAKAAWFSYTLEDWMKKKLLSLASIIIPGGC